MKTSNLSTKTAYLKPLLVTVILVTLYRLGCLVNIPFLDAEAIKDHFGVRALFDFWENNVSFSIFMLGLMPYISAYILVEIFSLCIPVLKKLRSGDYKGRQKLKQIAFFLALGLATYQASVVVSSLNNWDGASGLSLLTVSNYFEQTILIGVLVGAFLILLAICELISKFGLGHGISIVLLCGICADFISSDRVYIHNFKLFGLSAYIFALIAFCALVVLALLLLKTRISVPCYHEQDRNAVTYFQLNLAPSSTAALAYTSSVVMLPVTLSNVFDIGDGLASRLNPDSIGYYLLSILCIFIFSYLFAWAFLHPRRRVAKMAARGWHLVGMAPADAERFLLRKQFVYNLPWTLLLCILAVGPSLLVLATNSPFYVGGSTIPIVVAICMDLMGGFKFFQTGQQPLVKIAEFHDIHDATMIRNHLRAVGIQSHLRGYHHRLLNYFWGPYLEISLMVAYGDQARAQTVIQDFHGGLGLCHPDNESG